MATIRDLITAAFRHLNAVPTGEDVDPDYAADGLDNIRRLVSGWDLKLGTGDNASDWDFGTTFPLGDRLEDATTLLLAKRLSSQYGGAEGLDALELSDAERVIQAEALVLCEAEIDKGLAVMPSQYWGDRTYIR